ncbi:MAG TPA: glycosyltransferase [Burkholderiales bacterium]|nr:glycosyltransferase [Burkholderiales bacterium]
MAFGRLKSRWQALRKRYSDIMLSHKEATRTLLRIRLELFLSRAAKLTLPSSDDPAVSIIVITYNQPELVYGCLASIAETLQPGALPVEVIVLDNGSRRETLQVLAAVDGAKLIHSATNLHFLRGVNLAAKHARGRHILLLNSDAQLVPGTLEAAVRTLESAPDIGAVGARIVLPDATLQEAGSIIWNDGGCQGYGRGHKANDGEFMSRRDVDYCSGAFLLTRRALWERLGGFDERYAPCYYEETDYCVRLWESGYRVVYEPDAVILHYEFGSSSMSQGVSWMTSNLEKFRERHAPWLARQHPSSTRHVAARARPSSALRVLVVEDRVPHIRCGGGYPRANALLRELHAAGAAVTLFPTAQAEEDWPEVRNTVDPAIETLVEHSAATFADFIAERRGLFDAVIVCRPHNMETFADALKRVPDAVGDAAVFYDAEALFAPRAAVWREIIGEASQPGQAERELAAEIALTRPAHAVISVSPHERAIFEANGVQRSWVLGHALPARPTPASFDARMGFVFLGALYDDESPNAESLRWFAAEILPRLREIMGSPVKLAVVGGVEAYSIKALAPEVFELLGTVDDLASVFDRYRVMIAPTRIAAGIPHKVHEVAALGVPVVTTDLIATLLGWTPGRDVLATSDPAEYARLCARLHDDRELWRRVRDSALERVRTDCSPVAFRRTVREILAAVPEIRTRKKVTDKTVTGEAVTGKAVADTR